MPVKCRGRDDGDRYSERDGGADTASRVPRANEQETVGSVMDVSRRRRRSQGEFGVYASFTLSYVVGSHRALRRTDLSGAARVWGPHLLTDRPPRGANQARSSHTRCMSI